LLGFVQGPISPSETRASIAKGLAFDLDLNLPPPEDDAAAADPGPDEILLTKSSRSWE